MRSPKIFKLILLLLVTNDLSAQSINSATFSKEYVSRLQAKAKAVTIIRDNWGIPHIYGKTDADVVFGLLYAQCEDDFKRVEMNYIEKLGRSAEVKGESEIHNDLQIRLLIDSADAIRDYQNSPAWLKKLMDAYSDGINYYLYTHPSVKPALLTYFQPWYALLWTDGSIGAINTGGATVTELRNFYPTDTKASAAVIEPYREPLPSGSNGFAFAPSRTASGKAILYINPHVTFYFRPEVAVQSEEGLHAYGAVTWGQFFVYQGFNEHCGWMHTSSAADVADLYIEKVKKQDDGYVYEYDGRTRKVMEKTVIINYVSGGRLLSRAFKTYYTHHGPIMAARNGQWLAVKAMNRSMQSLIQSWQRTKADGLESYKKTMDLVSNTSNNTVFADDKGNIAYWHGNFMPKRDPSLNWSKPVDGSTSKTEWQGMHNAEEVVHVYNPASGWIQNCNSTPYTVSGNSSPKKTDYPAYMAPDGENFRGVNAAKVLDAGTQYTIDKVIKAGYDPHLAAFDVLVPALLKAYGNMNAGDADHALLKEPMQLLSNWDKNTGVNSVATTLAIEWGQKLMPTIMRSTRDGDQVEKTKQFAAEADAKQLLTPMVAVIKDLQQKFGNWQIPWGDINRYQRLSGNLTETYDDNKPSIPSGFAPSTWGCLPSFVSRSFNGTKKYYGYNGNSFICAVEFGKTVKAKSLLAGGESGDINSKHFGDQAEMYTKGIFKDVLFYKADVLKYVEKTYHPGDTK
jgi:acyl-homoserine-lactone acylase